MNRSPDVTHLIKALIEVQKILKPAARTQDNPFFKSTYTDLPGVWENCRKALTENHLAVVQTIGHEDGMVVVDTALFHDSGEFVSGSIKLKPVKDDPQAVGSAITYGRRYSLAAIVGVTSEEEDDDGERASGRGSSGSDKSDTKKKEKQTEPTKTFQPKGSTGTKLAPLVEEKSAPKAKTPPPINAGSPAPPVNGGEKNKASGVEGSDQLRDTKPGDLGKDQKGMTADQATSVVNEVFNEPPPMPEAIFDKLMTALTEMEKTGNRFKLSNWLKKHQPEIDTLASGFKVEVQRFISHLRDKFAR